MQNTRKTYNAGFFTFFHNIEPNLAPRPHSFWFFFWFPMKHVRGFNYRVRPTECRCFFKTDCLLNRLDFEQTVFIKLYTRISRIFPIIWFFLTIICFEWQYLKVRAKITSSPQNAGFFFQWYLQIGNRYLNRIFSVIF